jgi:hypothetical protein
VRFMIKVFNAWWSTWMHTFYNPCGQCSMLDSDVHTPIDAAEAWWSTFL